MDKLLVMSYVEQLLNEVEDAQSEELNDISFGKLLAYSEMLSKLQRILILEHPEAPAEYGLGFDVDRFVLFGGEKRQLDWAH